VLKTCHLARLVENLSSQLLAARRQTIERKDLDDDRFERPANLEVLYITSKTFITIDAVTTALSPWLTSDHALATEQWSIGRASPPGKRFVLKFHLLPLQNARLADSIATALKKDDGTYRQFHAVAADESKIPLSIFRDESSKERTQRIMGTVAKKAMGVLYPQMANVFTFKSRKLDTTVLKAGGEKAEAICIMQPSSTTIERDAFHWNYETLEELHINKTTLLDKIMELAARPEDSSKFRV